MIRFILCRRRLGEGHDLTTHYTIDADFPELERAITSGGFGEMGCDLTQLIGVEVVEDEEKAE